MMTIEFNKTGKRTNSFLGDKYRSEYTFTTTEKGPIAKFVYADFNATVELDGKTFQIKPVLGLLTIKKYVIQESDSLIGEIKTFRWSNRLSLVLQSGETYNLKRIYKSIWERFTNRSNYSIQLESGPDRIHYSFKKGAPFERGYNNERYKELKGQIESTTNNFSISIFGVFLIEHLLDQEHNY